MNKEREDLGEGQFLWRIEVEGYHAKTGRSAIGLGGCSSKERKFAHRDHDILTIAYVTAKNRAISDLIGLGEVSAEEIDAEQPTSPIPPTIAPAQGSQSLTCGHQKRLHSDTSVCMVGTKDGEASPDRQKRCRITIRTMFFDIISKSFFQNEQRTTWRASADTSSMSVA